MLSGLLGRLRFAPDRAAFCLVLAATAGLRRRAYPGSLPGVGTPWACYTCGAAAIGADVWRAARREATPWRTSTQGRSGANQLTFAYLTAGDGPLALCVHGFPDSPYSYRYLLPALAEAGYRAVAPFNRGFAPTELPDDRHHIHSSTMVADQMALHEALGGDSDAILIAHDWGAVGAWGAAKARNPGGGAAWSS